jgi:hypothetical protein
MPSLYVAAPTRRHSASHRRQASVIEQARNSPRHCRKPLMGTLKTRNQSKHSLKKRHLIAVV